MSIVKGAFMSDIHLPDNIPLEPVFRYVMDFKPDVLILGGDIADAKGMHGADSMKASDVDISHYERDCKLVGGLIQDIKKLAPKACLIYLEGNHEERYRRLAAKFPKTFGGTFNFYRDAVNKYNPSAKWVPYGTYDSYAKVGDCVFKHGDIWPDNHAKAYALRHTPNKVVYGHLHHFQAYTTHRPGPYESPRYAVTAGCLARMDPDWKKGTAHQWINGFVSFISDAGVTVPTVHLIEKGQFNVGGKVYK